MAIMHFNFTSKYLRMSTDVMAIMPDLKSGMDPKDFYTQGKKYPVLWLLHGATGDYSDWIRKSNIELYACERDLIVIMPSGLNSYYGDWPYYGGGLYVNKYITEELMPLVYAWLPVSDKKEDNFIGGLSMGGQGTLRFVAEHPEKYAAACVLSAPAIEYRSKYEEELNSPNHGHKDYVDQHGGIDAFMASPENTRGIYEKLAAEGRINELPPIFFESGGGDHYLFEVEDTVDFLKKLGYPCEVRTFGDWGHEWRYWDIAIQHALDFFAEINPKLAVK